MVASLNGRAQPSGGCLCRFESCRDRHAPVVQWKGTALRTLERKLDAGSSPARCAVKCSKCFKNKPPKLFPVNRSKKSGRHSSCLHCQRIYTRAHYRKNKVAYLAKARRNAAQVVTAVRAAKNVPCTDCGVRYPHYVMDFDHVRGVKKWNIGNTGAAPKAVVDIQEKLLYEKWPWAASSEITIGFKSRKQSRRHRIGDPGSRGWKLLVCQRKRCFAFSVCGKKRWSAIVAR